LKLGEAGKRKLTHTTQRVKRTLKGEWQGNFGYPMERSKGCENVLR